MGMSLGCGSTDRVDGAGPDGSTGALDTAGAGGNTSGVGFADSGATGDAGALDTSASTGGGDAADPDTSQAADAQLGTTDGNALADVSPTMDVPPIEDVAPVPDIPPSVDVPTTPDVATTPDTSMSQPDTSGGSTEPEVACPSGITWFLGDLGSKWMHPGRACIGCHTQKDAPTFTVAGTIFIGFHTVDECQGAGFITVEITDANGSVHSTDSNLAGNFYIKGDIPFPYTARVIQNGTERKMLSAQSNGDCNTCHTKDGFNAAPGRIHVP